MFPFTYNNQTYYNCIITGPSNPTYSPQCLVDSNTWSICSGIYLFLLFYIYSIYIIIKIKVPTDAVVNFVTTRKDGWSGQNGASLNGGTLVWIFGYSMFKIFKNSRKVHIKKILIEGFAPNLFSITTSPLTSNIVLLENSIASYSCEIFADKVTTTQIACLTP